VGTRPRLVHLNGVPGCGKSTLARLYTDQHPQALNLDVDAIVPMLGGWADDFFAAFDVARGLAASMAERHLLAGRDVVLPQMITNQRESDDFERASAAAGADYLHIVIDVEPGVAMTRIDGRSTEADDLHRIIREVIRRHGDLAFIEKLKSQVDTFVAAKQLRGRVDASNRSVQGTYTLVDAALPQRSP
jgi:predicted kinase